MKAIGAALAGVVLVVVLIGSTAAGSVTALTGAKPPPLGQLPLPTHGAGTTVDPPGSGTDARMRARVLAYAYNQLGDPYLYGGTTPAGFDCSGLTQAAYATAGVSLARTSEEQWLTTTPVNPPQAGDLVFFNPGEDQPGLPGHVGIYLGNGYMISAPHTGTTVTIAPVNGFGAYLGATAPAAS